YEVEGLEEDAAIEYRQVDKLCPEVPRHDVNPRLTELALFIEAGRAPVKVSREIRGYLRKEGSDLVGFFTFPDGTPPIFFRTGVSPVISIDNPGVLFTFAFPDYVRQERLIYSCRVVIDGIEAGEAVPLDLIEETALSAFKKKLGMILLKSAFRTYVKTLAQTKLKKKGGGVVDILGKVLSAVDKADTRSWQTLPAEIDLYRMEVTAGSHEVYVKFIGEHGGVLGESEKVTFSLEKGKKQIVYIPGPV
ncbi:MAG: hypothetical protein KAX38_06880, partial [Candidatus Krumholzibacteria bacterium]|nr:hypothetical protein [Candidatus Krumholzibacteria bacterium]